MKRFTTALLLLACSPVLFAQNQDGIINPYEKDAGAVMRQQSRRSRPTYSAPQNDEPIYYQAPPQLPQYQPPPPEQHCVIQYVGDIAYVNCY